MKKYALLSATAACLIASTSFAANPGTLPPLTAAQIQAGQVTVAPPLNTVWLNFENNIDTGDGSAYALQVSYFTSNDDPSTACYTSSKPILQGQSTTSVYHYPDYSPDLPLAACSGSNIKVVIQVSAGQNEGKLTSNSLTIDTSAIPLRRICNYIISAVPVTGSEQYRLTVTTDPACGSVVSSALPY